MIRTTAKDRQTKLPDTYFELVRQHPLTSIRTDAELDAAQAIIDDLLPQQLDKGGRTYLDALSDLVIVYEREHHPVDPLPPHQLIAQMLQDRGMSQADLVRATGIAKATVSDLVTGKRSFTVEQMHAIANLFGLPAGVFLPSAAEGGA